jgi:hypothetical protein
MIRRQYGDIDRDLEIKELLGDGIGSRRGNLPEYRKSNGIFHHPLRPRAPGTPASVPAPPGALPQPRQYVSGWPACRQPEAQARAAGTARTGGW